MKYLISGRDIRVIPIENSRPQKAKAHASNSKTPLTETKKSGLVFQLAAFVSTTTPNN